MAPKRLVRSPGSVSFVYPWVRGLRDSRLSGTSYKNSSRLRSESCDRNPKGLEDKSFILYPWLVTEVQGYNMISNRIRKHAEEFRSSLVGKKINRLTPGPKILKSFVDEGYKNLHFSLVKSYLPLEQNGKLRVLSPALNTLALPVVVNFDRRLVDSLEIDVFKVNEELKSEAKLITKKVYGNTLTVYIITKDDVFKEDEEHLLAAVLSEVRFLGGLSAATELLASRDFDLQAGTDHLEFRGSTIDHWILDENSTTSTWDPNREDFPHLNFTLCPEAALLLNGSYYQKEISLMFLMIWLALEAQVGNGPRLKQHFQKIGTEPQILSLITKLSKVRGDLSHRGKKIRSIDPVYQTFNLLRLAAIDNQEQFRSENSKFARTLDGQL